MRSCLYCLFFLGLFVSCSQKEHVRVYENCATDWQEDNLVGKVKSTAWFYARLLDDEGNTESMTPIALVQYNDQGMRTSAVNYDQEGTLSLSYEYDDANRLVKRVTQFSDSSFYKEHHIIYDSTHGKAVENRQFRADSLHSCVFSEYYPTGKLSKMYAIQDNDTNWIMDNVYNDKELTQTVIKNITNLEQYLKYDIFKNFMERFDIHLSPTYDRVLLKYEYDNENRRVKEFYYLGEVLFRETNFDKNYNLIAESVKGVLDMKYDYKIDKQNNWTEQRAYQWNPEDNCYDLVFVKNRQIEYFD